MHYGTFPVLTGTPEELGKELRRQGVRARPMAMPIGKPTVL
jgi:hypothetical protein